MNLSNDVIIHKQDNGIQYLQFKKLLQYKDVINHAYTLGLNVDFKVSKLNKESIKNDGNNKVMIDFQNICSAINTDYKHIVVPNQQHSKKVKIVNEKYNLDRPDINLEQYKNVDGLITNKRNIVLSTTNADCILLLFFDPVNMVIANVHSGWKGTLQQISVETVRKMKNNFNCKMENIICCICPSIRKCHFEVEKDVRDLYYDKFRDLQQINTIIEETKQGIKWHIDTVLINKIILQKEGLLLENIIDCGICSVCNSDIIHSYRVEKKGYGLETALIELKDKEEIK